MDRALEWSKTVEGFLAMLSQAGGSAQHAASMALASEPRRPALRALTFVRRKERANDVANFSHSKGGGASSGSLCWHPLLSRLGQGITGVVEAWLALRRMQPLSKLCTMSLL